MTEINCSYTHEIVCPYCGYEFSDSWEIGDGDQDIGEMVCHNCEKTFLAYRNVEVTYSTWIKEGNEKTDVKT